MQISAVGGSNRPTTAIRLRSQHYEPRHSVAASRGIARPQHRRTRRWSAAEPHSHRLMRDSHWQMTGCDLPRRRSLQVEAAVACDKQITPLHCRGLTLSVSASAKLAGEVPSIQERSGSAVRLLPTAAISEAFPRRHQSRRTALLIRLGSGIRDAHVQCPPMTNDE